MSFETDRTQVPLWLIYIAPLVILTGVCSYWYVTLDATEAKMLGLVGGIVTGLIVYLLTFFTLLKPLKELDKFKRMGIKALLSHRHDQNYYRMFVGVSNRRVDVMGASCGRFVQDFLDVDSEDKVLVDALNAHSNLKIRLLIPDDTHLGESAKAALPFVLGKISALHARFPEKIAIRRFPSKAHHSFVIADNDVIAGPILGDDKSKYSPAVHAAAETAFGRKYEEYFDGVWNSCPTNA